MKNRIAGNVNANRKKSIANNVKKNVNLNLGKYSTEQLFNALNWWAQNISGHFGKYRKGRTLLGMKKYTRNGANITRKNIENDIRNYLKVQRQL
jgi:hypothetical protein